MSVSLYTSAIPFLWVVSISGITWYLAKTAAGIQYVTLADGQQQKRSVRFLIRVLLPFTVNIVPLLKDRGKEKMIENLRRKIIAAGLESIITVNQYRSLRILSPIVYGTLGVATLHVILPHLPGGLGRRLASQLVLFDLGVVLVAFLYPRQWLNGEIRKRGRSIERALPFVLDLLTLSVEAGMDFMTAMNRIIERRAMDPLGEELLRAFREVQLGKTRREALRNMAKRADHADLKSVVQALVQADELGVSIGSILRIQSDQMRTRRFQRAEKLANEAPVKMLFPLVAFIFPAVFIILLGPIILQFMQQGF